MKKRVKAGTSKAAAADRRARFVEAYIANGGNATEAAKTAGFSPKTSASQARRLLKDVRVASAVKRRRVEAGSKYELTTERVLKECARIVYADPRKLFGPDGNPIPIPKLDDDAAAAVAGFEHVEEFSGRGKSRELSGYTKKLKLWDKNSAIDKAMKHLGLFEKDNAQHPAVGDVHITVVGVPAASHKAAR